MCHLLVPMKCIFREFCHCVNIINCTYTNLDDITHCTWNLYGLIYYLMGPLSYMLFIIDWNVFYLYGTHDSFIYMSIHTCVWVCACVSENISLYILKLFIICQQSPSYILIFYKHRRVQIEIPFMFLYIPFTFPLVTLHTIF